MVRTTRILWKGGMGAAPKMLHVELLYLDQVFRMDLPNVTRTLLYLVVVFNGGGLGEILANILYKRYAPSFHGRKIADTNNGRPKVYTVA